MNKPLDQSATGERERPELHIDKHVDYHAGKIDYYVAGEHYGEEVTDLSESDWIPCIVAAHVTGVSKQAISDRIRRGTLECREVQRRSWWNGCNSGTHVKLVRLGDVRKKRKAGRPKGSRNSKRTG